jgi:hypothetical protein
MYTERKIKNETKNQNDVKQNEKRHSHFASRSVLYPGREENQLFTLIIKYFKLLDLQEITPKIYKNLVKINSMKSSVEVIYFEPF